MGVRAWLAVLAAITAIVTTSSAPLVVNPAYAGVGNCKGGNNGFGNGGYDGVPGNSGKQDKTR